MGSFSDCVPAKKGNGGNSTSTRTSSHQGTNH